MARVTPYSGLFWKQLVSEVGTWEKLCIEHVFQSL